MKNYSRFFRVVVVGLGSLALGGYQVAHAAQVVDQSFTNPPYSSASVESLTGDTLFAESFTVGRLGLLDGADVLAFDGTSWFGGNPPPVSDLTVQIRTFSGGAPTDTILASGTVSASNLVANPNGQFTHVDFASGVIVTQGEVLALVISGAGVGWYVQLGADATYAGGQAFAKGHASYPWGPYPDPGGRSADFLFQTYVKVPDLSPKMVSSQLTSGVFHVCFKGAANHAFTIDRAGSSAGPWQLGITNLTSDANGNFDLFDPVSPGASSGFYRVR